MPRWVKVCQDCYGELEPDQYCPELTDWDACDRCGDERLVASVHPSVLVEE